MHNPKSCFTYIWKIENFSMCPRKRREYISSSVFEVESLLKSFWKLRLFPKGDKHADHIACFLGKIESVGSSMDLNIYFRFSLIVGTEMKHAKLNHSTFRTNEEFGNSKFVSFEDLNKFKETYLPNDTLTIKCEMWDAATDVQSFGPNNYTIQCFVQTRIRKRKKSVLWHIKKFSALLLHQKLSLDVVSVLNQQRLLNLTFYLTGECADNLCGQIDIKKDNDFSGQVFVKCQVSVPYELEKYKVEDEHLFESNAENDVWTLPTFIQFSALLKDKYLDTTGDILHLFFQFTFSCSEQVYTINSEESLPSSCYSIAPCKTFNPLQKDFQNLYQEGKFSDLTLMVGNKEFKVHKCILSSRSSVFSAMLEADMKERQTGVVDITDLEGDTVDQMLYFMYTNVLEDIKVEEALKLYSAAEKYEVLSLSCKCRCILKDSLNVSNVSNILSLADLHQDKELLDAIHNFIQADTRTIFLSQEWQSFITSNSLLAARVMCKLLI